MLEVVDVATYLGDQFNSKGTNSDLIKERVKKAKACTVNSMSLCGETTLGLFTIHVLLLLYQCIFLAVVLYNSQAWSNLTNKDIIDLETVQLKYLKRMLHAPPSTSNALTYLETGSLPIKYEIHVRQFTFLHHILTLEESDPVRKTYDQQLKYPFEPNWGNTVNELRTMYGISQTNEDISQLSKEMWKRIVKERVKHSH